MPTHLFAPLLHCSSRWRVYREGRAQLFQKHYTYRLFPQQVPAARFTSRTFSHVARLTNTVDAGRIATLAKAAVWLLLVLAVKPSTGQRKRMHTNSALPIAAICVHVRAIAACPTITPSTLPLWSSPSAAHWLWHRQPGQAGNTRERHLGRFERF